MDLHKQEGDFFPLSGSAITASVGGRLLSWTLGNKSHSSPNHTWRAEFWRARGDFRFRGGFLPADWSGSDWAESRLLCLPIRPSRTQGDNLGDRERNLFGITEMKRLPTSSLLAAPFAIASAPQLFGLFVCLTRCLLSDQSCYCELGRLSPNPLNQCCYWHPRQFAGFRYSDAAGDLRKQRCPLRFSPCFYHFLWHVKNMNQVLNAYPSLSAEKNLQCDLKYIHICLLLHLHARLSGMLFFRADRGLA